VTLIDRDLKHIWHPCAQMKDYESFAPLPVKSARGCHITLNNGKTLIDAISSWWCKSLGHGEPRIQQAIIEQLQTFEHVLLANTTNETIVQLSEQLAQLAPPLSRVLYASDGSCAVEIALKMSVHAQQLAGRPQKKHFMALANDYHGETCLALSVSDLGLYKDPYQTLLTPCDFIRDIPYVSDIDDPLWHDCHDVWKKAEAQLQEKQGLLAAIIVEPILQGAAGMKIYSADFLRRLAAWCKAHDVYLIVDEILTGLGRTGLPLASQHAHITADFICLSKGLTAGFLPLSAVLTHDAIYELFYDDYSTGKAFLHSHTHSGNALAAAAALATFNVLKEDNVYRYVQQTLAPTLYTAMQEVAKQTGKLHHIRHLGGVVAADLINPHHHPRLGYAVYQQAVQLGALLRPLGNTIYWLPPLNMDIPCVGSLRDITIQAINQSL
jgi:adenosylmethionine---8-amino-7-oxononanoate aminotransferase